MSSARSRVDYGPIALAVGPVQEASVNQESSSHIGRDSIRLRSLLGRSDPKKNRPEFDCHSAMEAADCDGTFEGMPDETALMLELQQLWTSNGKEGVREVRLRLPEAILPQTWVRIYENIGALQIELTPALEGTRQWLDRCASRLAEEIADRLQRSVSVSIRNANGLEISRAQFQWEDGISS
ncbi:hypothetical protein [Noviherbaspirillum suwonense]|jgi:hypothetical protein|uniref:hypothetical protein n=1 Tax=Noviherbaspirillum suwonense TaxID=1224511 RepID=UPI0024B823FD|nr:hypothetical protein [Noviherbaspirillum suwonense]